MGRVPLLTGGDGGTVWNASVDHDPLRVFST
jgi:hypothetical protein